MNADDVIDLLGLARHPEGGWYRETYRDEASTAIWFLLRAGERSGWHRVHDSAEIWHHYVGDPLALGVSLDGVAVESMTLGSDLAAGERPQVVVPPGAWQSAELAPSGWVPG